MTSVEELPVPLRLEWSGCPKVAQRPLSLKTEAGMESNPSSEVASLEPCTTPAGAVKLHKKLELNPKESQDIKALQKNPEQSAKLVKQKGITLESTQAAVGLTLGVLFGKVFS